MIKEEFRMGNYKVVRTNRGCNFYYIPRENTEPKKMKLARIINLIANDRDVPKQIKAASMIWTYEEGFGQYKNSNCQELIKYLSGYYDHYESGLTYPAIFKYEVEVIKNDI